MSMNIALTDRQVPEKARSQREWQKNWDLSMSIPGQCTVLWHSTFCATVSMKKEESAVVAVCDRIDVALRYVDGNQMVLFVRRRCIYRDP